MVTVVVVVGLGSVCCAWPHVVGDEVLRFCLDLFGTYRVQGLGLFLGRHLGHFIFSPIGLKRILLTNIFQRL